MSFLFLAARDFFRTGVATWLVLLIIELLRPGAVHRIINLEYFFYLLLAIFLALMIWQRNK